MSAFGHIYMGTRFFLQPDQNLISDIQLLTDLRRVAALRKPPQIHLTGPYYQSHGRYSINTFFCRFGGWNNALIRAGLSVSHRYRIPDLEFFTSLERLWRLLASRPVPLRTRSCENRHFQRRLRAPFRLLGAALRAFADWANSKSFHSAHAKLPNHPPKPKLTTRHPNAHPLKSVRTPRQPVLGLRHQILRRDHYRCVHCGRSPATDPRIVLHIDHIHPWSKGGPTTKENLQTLCHQCNAGKSTAVP